jgi:hypothetical protein
MVQVNASDTLEDDFLADVLHFRRGMGRAMVQVNASDTLEDDFLADVLQVAGASLTIALDAGARVSY